MSESVGDLSHLLDRPIAFHRAFVSLTGSVTAALFLSQAVYWQRRSEEWFWKTQEQWEEETGLSRREQDSARKRLKDLGVMREERRGNPAKLYFSVDLQAVVEALQGKAKKLSVDEILRMYASELAALSAFHYRRAKDLGVVSEFVDLAEVLTKKGAVCHLCSRPIVRGPGRKPEFLHFDHKVPLSEGGSNTFDNIYPAHAACNLAKSGTIDDVPPVQPSLHVNVQSSLHGNVRSSLHVNVQSIKEAETTTETTAETTQPVEPVQLFSEELVVKKSKPIIPDWVPEDAWASFVEMRKLMKAPLTDRAVELAVSTLEKLKMQGSEPRAVLEQSILHNWKGLFAVKEDFNGNGRKTRADEQQERNRRIITEYS